MLHEMGHIAQSQRKGTMNRRYRKEVHKMMKDIKKGQRLGESKYKKNYRIGKSALRNVFVKPLQI